MKRYRIIVADDHVIFRQGMKKLIGEVPGLEVVGEANNGLELLTILEKTEADMVLLDIAMPKLRGIEASREIRKRYPHLDILILTMHKNKEYLHHALSAGARGYLLKEDSDMELLSAIETLRKGGVYITRILAEELADELQEIKNGNWRPDWERLSKREREILMLISEGKQNKEIASILSISTRTAEAHRANVMKKLNMSSTAELVKYAIEKRISGINL